MYTNDEEPTTEIPIETMLEARERSIPARVSWTCEDGHLPSGPDRPTRDMHAIPQRAGHEITAVDGIPVAVDPDHEDTEPLLRLDRVA